MAPDGPLGPVAPLLPLAPDGPLGPVAPLLPLAPLGPDGPLNPLAVLTEEPSPNIIPVPVLNINPVEVNCATIYSAPIPPATILTDFFGVVEASTRLPPDTPPCAHR